MSQNSENDNAFIPIGRMVDAKCHERTASWARASPTLPKCDFFETLERLSSDDGIGNLITKPNVYTLQSLKEACTTKGICPYFLARKAISEATVVIYGYPYLLDPKIAEMISKGIPKEAIVIFDEAHNIDQVCIDGLSVKITPRTLENSSRAINSLVQKVREKKENDLQKLTEEYNQLIMGLRAATTPQSQQLSITDILIGSG